MEHSTTANPPPKPTHKKPNGGGLAAVQTFSQGKLIGKRLSMSARNMGKNGSN
jgi:hypothetical protein